MSDLDHIFRRVLQHQLPHLGGFGPSSVLGQIRELQIQLAPRFKDVSVIGLVRIQPFVLRDRLLIFFFADQLVDVRLVELDTGRCAIESFRVQRQRFWSTTVGCKCFRKANHAVHIVWMNCDPSFVVSYQCERVRRLAEDVFDASACFSIQPAFGIKCLHLLFEILDGLVGSSQARFQLRRGERKLSRLMRIAMQGGELAVSLQSRLEIAVVIQADCDLFFDS